MRLVGFFGQVEDLGAVCFTHLVEDNVSVVAKFNGETQLFQGIEGQSKIVVPLTGVLHQGVDVFRVASCVVCWCCIAKRCITKTIGFDTGPFGT